MNAQRHTRTRVETTLVLMALSLPAALAARGIEQGPKEGITQEETAPVTTGPSSMPDEFQPTEGWVWIMTPEKIKPGISHLLLLSPEEEEVASTSWRQIGGFATALVPQKVGTTYAVAAFDAHHRRIELRECSTHDGFAASAISRIKDTGAVYAGIEALTAEAQQKNASLAFEKAKKKGLSPLPYIGDRDVPETWPKGAYDFELNIARLVTRKLFPDRVIIIDCWATWCSPCMQLMPELVELSKKYEKQVSIISITYDEDAKKARKTLESLGVRWPLFILPRDREDRALWLTSFRGKNDGTVPVIIVIDRAGRMRQVHPLELESTVEKLVESTSSPTSREHPQG